jgi:hypothetical protein
MLRGLNEKIAAFPKILAIFTANQTHAYITLIFTQKGQKYTGQIPATQLVPVL